MLLLSLECPFLQSVSFRPLLAPVLVGCPCSVLLYHSVLSTYPTVLMSVTLCFLRTETVCCHHCTPSWPVLCLECGMCPRMTPLGPPHPVLSVFPALPSPLSDELYVGAGELWIMLRVVFKVQLSVPKCGVMLPPHPGGALSRCCLDLGRIWTLPCSSPSAALREGQAGTCRLLLLPGAWGWAICCW